ncbi:hypothetical protein QOZ80_9BG0714620 [Eleusine coracana subsp. coracana]|nr:hypothetical protein QOZ80_9BG0714620 [Eleusine coracana subsp. coracana]
MASSEGKSRSVAGRALTPGSAGGGGDGSTITTIAETAVSESHHDMPGTHDGFTGPEGLDADQFSNPAVTETVTGSHVLRIDSFSETKELAVGDYIESGTFRVGGHSWRVVCYPCGDEEETAGWVSLFLRLVDAGDNNNVKAGCQFTLMDSAVEEDPVQSIRIKPHTFSMTDQSRGCDFIKREELESSLLKDDCFGVRCDVIILVEHKSPLQAPPPPELHRHLEKLLASQVGKDVTFEVGGEQFTAHRCVLAARSSVFMAELFGPEKEEEGAIMAHVKVGDMEPEVFKVLLHFIYTDSLPDEVDGNDDGTNKVKMVQRLLVAADRYDMKRLKVISEHILCGSVDASTAAAMLLLASKHGCQRLKEACVTFLEDLLASVAVEEHGDEAC